MTLQTLEAIFWLCLFCVGYTYVGYPLCLAALARLCPRPVQRGSFSGSVSIIVAVRNEEATICRRIEELTSQLKFAGVGGEVIVVSNGSTDRTADLARRYQGDGLVQIVELSDDVGKATSLSEAALKGGGDILVFADARQFWAEDALARLLENFADPTVGAVSGDLVLESAPGVLAGVGLYWRFEKWLRQKESLVFSQIGVTGAISAVRQVLFHPIPPGTILDDVYWPLQVNLLGWRVVHDARARAYDRLPDKPRDEFRRKVRTLAGNFQIAARLPRALMPWRNRVWWPLFSHKMLRLVVPWALLGMLACSALLPDSSYQGMFWGQLAGYSLGLAGLFPPLGRSVKLLGAAGSFLVLNAAAWFGFWVWVTGRTNKAWLKIRYESTALLDAARQAETCDVPGTTTVLSAR